MVAARVVDDVSDRGHDALAIEDQGRVGDQVV